MDPYLEGPERESFHSALIVDLGDAISPLVEPKYVARAQRRVYVERPIDEDVVLVADTAIFDSADQSGSASGTLLATASVAPVEAVLAMPEERIEPYLTIREAATQQVVTVIEVLSPSNKRAGDGRREYLEKRLAVLQSRTNLVELDLLRGGHRLPMKTRLPRGDYYVIISRAGRRPRAEVYPWTVRQSLPAIPIPLRPGEPDVVLELQPVFDSRYDRGRYRQTLDYTADLRPALHAQDAEWLADLLQRSRGE
jgi:hypothetical protein